MKPISFYLVTDTHYLNNILEPGGEAFEKNMVTEQFFVKESGAIISSTFDKIIEDKETDIVILPGDLVKNGEKIDLRGMLLNTIGNNKGFSDNNAEFTLK
ncbi:MAG: hypothetical protein IKU66_01900 [Clostridia bacterium]|nr:hypothetical protein [Clostridia bacterium]MBR5544203.1 hypothetical protein [Clostridia bacterium]